MRDASSGDITDVLRLADGDSDRCRAVFEFLWSFLALLFPVRGGCWLAGRELWAEFCADFASELNAEYVNVRLALAETLGFCSSHTRGFPETPFWVSCDPLLFFSRKSARLPPSRGTTFRECGPAGAEIVRDTSLSANCRESLGEGRREADDPMGLE